MDNTFLKKIVSYFVLAAVFISGSPLADVGFSLYWYHLVYIIFVAFAILSYHKIDLRILFVLFFIAVYSLSTFKEGLSLVIKQLLNITFFTIASYYIIVYENYDIEEIFKKYINLAKVILLLGLIQVILFFLGQRDLFIFFFPFLKHTHISLRLQSITLEPSFFTFSVTPVVFVSIYNLWHKKIFFINRAWSWLFLLGYLLTVSSIAYTGIIIMLCLLYFENFTLRKLSLFGFVVLGISLFGFISYQNVSEIKLRVDDTLYGLGHDLTDPKVYKKINPSTYALLSNFYVTKKELIENPLAGNGLGTHELAYGRYLPQPLKSYLTLNNTEAGSLALRLLSETGLLGFSLFIFVLLKYKVTSGLSTNLMPSYHVINTSIFVMMILLLLRSGDYTFHGRILFLLIYYYSYRMIEKWTK